MFVPRLRQCSVRPRAVAAVSKPRLLSTNRLDARRATSSATASSSRISTVFGALLAVGIATTSFGLYEFYSSFTLWPPEVRSDLRAGVKAKHQGDLDLSERYFQRAWETTKTLSPSVFGSEPHLKVTGILISFAEVLEANNKPGIAFDIMSDFLEKLPPRDLDTVQKEWSGPERMRLVAIAYKLGEMAETYSQPPEEEEKWLTWSVTELLSTLRQRQNEKSEPVPVLHELELPSWVTKTDVVAPLQALGEYYSRVGKADYAVTLYGQLISMLISDNSMEKTTLPDRCRAAQVMTNLSELLMRSSPIPAEPTAGSAKRLEQAEYWALAAVKFVTSVSDLEPGKVGDSDVSACSEGLAVMFSNLAAVNMAKGQPKMARQLLEVAASHATAVGNTEQLVQVRRLLKEAQRAEQKLDGTTRPEVL